MFKAKSRVEGERLSVGCYPVLITRADYPCCLPLLFAQDFHGTEFVTG